MQELYGIAAFACAHRPVGGNISALYIRHVEIETGGFRRAFRNGDDEIGVEHERSFVKVCHESGFYKGGNAVDRAEHAYIEVLQRVPLKSALRKLQSNVLRVGARSVRVRVTRGKGGHEAAYIGKDRAASVSIVSERDKACQAGGVYAHDASRNRRVGVLGFYVVYVETDAQTGFEKAYFCGAVEFVFVYGSVYVRHDGRAFAGSGRAHSVFVVAAYEKACGIVGHKYLLAVRAYRSTAEFSFAEKYT